MPFKPGQSGNPGGRKPGTPNRVTGNIRDFYENFIRQNAEQIQRDFNKLSAKDRIAVLIQFSKFVLPTLSSTELTTDYNRMNDEQLNYVIKQLVDGE